MCIHPTDSGFARNCPRSNSCLLEIINERSTAQYVGGTKKTPSPSDLTHSANLDHLRVTFRTPRADNWLIRSAAHALNIQCRTYRVRLALGTLLRRGILDRYDCVHGPPVTM